MTQNSLNDGYLMPEEQNMLLLGIGRIEQAIVSLKEGQADIKLDLESMAQIQEKATARTMALEMRVESLERWQMIHNERCASAAARAASRTKIVGGAAAILLLPTISWMGQIWGQVAHILEAVDRLPKK